MKRFLLSALVDSDDFADAIGASEDTPKLVLFKHARRCPNGGRITASQCSCETIVEVQPLTREALRQHVADERKAVRLATN